MGRGRAGAGVAGRAACPGCGAVLPGRGLDAHGRYNASGESWFLFGEFAAYDMARLDPTFLHQLAVDACGAQHSGPATRAVAAAFALVGLCLALEHGCTGRRVQRLHMELAKRRRVWPRLEPPGPRGAARCGR